MATTTNNNNKHNILAAAPDQEKKNYGREKKGNKIRGIKTMHNTKKE